MTRRFLVVPLLALAAMASAFDDPLTLGSPAPKLAVKSWLKGTPVTDLAPDKTYVIEFGASWSPTAKTDLARFVEIARANKEMTFLAIDVMEDASTAKAFAASLAGTVDVPVGYGGNLDGLTDTWLNAAAQVKLPSTFVVKDGKVQWIGAPEALPTALTKMKAGSYDLNGEKAAYEQSVASDRKMIALTKELDAVEKLFSDGKRDQAHTQITTISANYPDGGPEAVAQKEFDWLTLERPNDWEAAAKDMIAGKKPADLAKVCEALMYRASKPGGADFVHRNLDKVLQATDYKDMTVLEYANDIADQLNDDKMALDVTNRLLAALPTSDMKDDAEYKATLQKRKATLEAKLAKA